MISPGIYFHKDIILLIPFYISEKQTFFDESFRKVSDIFEEFVILCDEFGLFLPDLRGKNKYYEISSEEIEPFLKICSEVEVLLKYLKTFWNEKNYEDYFNLREYVKDNIDNHTIDCFAIILRDYLSSFYKNLENLCFDHVEVSREMFQEKSQDKSQEKAQKMKICPAA